MADHRRFRYWLALPPDSSKPIGGVKQMHRLAEALENLGREATLIQGSKDFHPGWFGSNVATVSVSKWRTLAGLDPLRDLVIVPETNPAALLRYAPGLRKIVFNQNGHYTFLAPGSRQPLNVSDVKSIYQHPSVLHTLCVSSYDHALLTEGLGVEDDSVTILPNPVEVDIFTYPSHPKRRQIAYMPRKNSQDALIVTGLLKQQPWLKSWDIIPIDRQPQSTVASILQDSLIFLSFGHPEGFGLPVAEAMASGCYCIGYTGLGARDLYALAELTCTAINVEPADWMGFLKAVREVVTVYRIDSQTMLGNLAKHSATIHSRYNITAFRKALKSALVRIEGLAST